LLHFELKRSIKSKPAIFALCHYCIQSAIWSENVFKWRGEGMFLRFGKNAASIFRVTKLGQVDTEVTWFKAACLREFGHRTFAASTWLYVRLKRRNV